MTTMTRPLFNQPKEGERRAVEHDDYTVIEQWNGKVFIPRYWVFAYEYKDGPDWIVSDGPPYWTNRLPGRLWWSQKGQNAAINAALYDAHFRFPHHPECNCERCNPADYEISI
jgi:hypothetical protein